MSKFKEDSSVTWNFQEQIYHSEKETPNTRDDDTTLSRILFGILAFMTMCVFMSGVTNAYLLYKNGRFKNFDLIFFYFFALITLICKDNKKIKL
jgi:hypothetical protein